MTGSLIAHSTSAYRVGGTVFAGTVFAGHHDRYGESNRMLAGVQSMNSQISAIDAMASWRIDSTAA